MCGIKGGGATVYCGIKGGGAAASVRCTVSYRSSLL